MSIIRRNVLNVPTGNKMLRIGDKRDILVREFELEEDDLVKFKPMYESAFFFFTEEGFRHPQDGTDKIEDFYWERWTPTGAKEQHVWWRMYKDITPVIRWFVIVNFQTLNMTKKETQWKGKKIDGEKTDVVIRVKCYIQFDINDTLKNSVVWKIRRTFFNKIYYNEMEQAKENLKKFSVKIERFFKQYLEMIPDQEAPVDFWAPRGYKEP